MRSSSHERFPKDDVQIVSVADARCIVGDSALDVAPMAVSNSEEERRRLLHSLANVVTGLLMNAQAVDWKLPPYSRLKRSIVEIARGAERAAELTRQLQHAFESPHTDAPPSTQEGENSTHLAEDLLDSRPKVAVTAQEPGGKSMADPLQASGRHAAPGFYSTSRATLTTHCDRCTSKVFPKRDDGDEH